jgi:hypothetical protein
MEKLPSKIKNLYLLQRVGANVPFFIVVDSGKYKNIDQELERIKEEFRNQNIKSIIIRSASFSEDLEDRSRAGFFESSKEILLDDLGVEKIKYFWNNNKKKVEDNNLGEFFIFIQEYFNSDYSGVLFTEDYYDKDQSIIALSRSDHAITDGLSSDKKIIYDKKKNYWNDDNFLNKETKLYLKKIIKKTSQNFPMGADIEFSIKDKDVRFYQIRPITRNKDEKILSAEKKRLKNKFDTSFNNQLWGKNGFVEALGDLTPLSLSLYNYLLNIVGLKDLLKRAKVIDKFLDNNYSLLEDIGGRTYFNFFQEKKVFLRKEGKWNNFKRTVLFLSGEQLIKKENLEQQKKEKTIENTFAWFFLSGIYLQFFLEQEKKKYKKGEFIERLKNTEQFCNAEEPRPISLNNMDLDNFLKKYYYLADYPYELSSIRFSDLDRYEIKEKYQYFKKEINGNEKYLNKKIQFWLKSKVFWKERFLKSLVKKKNELIKKHGEEIFQANNWEGVIKGENPQIVVDDDIKISSNYLKISGKNYPFGFQDKHKKEIIIVPGINNFENLNYYIEGEDPEKYFGKYLVINIFPSDWITYIPKFKGIVLKEGNELSHMAITSREYNIPCIIKSDIFNKKSNEFIKK